MSGLAQKKDYFFTFTTCFLLRLVCIAGTRMSGQKEIKGLFSFAAEIFAAVLWQRPTRVALEKIPHPVVCTVAMALLLTTGRETLPTSEDFH